MVICRAIKHYEERWRVEDRAHAVRLKSVRAEAAIKMVWERIRQNPSWKQKIMSWKLNISNTSSLASSGTIYAWERTAAQRDTSLLLLWRSSSGQEQSISFSGMPRTGTKHPLHGRENLHHWGAVQQPEQQVLCLNVPWGVFWGCRWVIILPMSWFGGGVSHQGVTPLHICEKGVKLVPECMKRMCYKELWNLLTWPSSMVRNGSSSRTQLLPTKPRRFKSGCGGTFWPSSAPRIGPRGVQTSNPWTVNCGLFWRTWLAKSAWRAWRDPSWRQRQRSPWRQCVRWQQSGRSVSRLALRQRKAILSDNIINGNLKLLQINYLVLRVDALFNFSSRLQNL